LAPFGAVVVVEETLGVVEVLASVEAQAAEVEVRSTGVSEHTAAAIASNSRLRCRATGGRIGSAHRLGGGV
jgi:hypothetical protein